MSSWPRDPKAFALLPEKCERVNLKASQLLRSRRGSLKKKRGREVRGGLLFLSSVFFHSSITQCGEGSFSPTHHRCQRGHTQTMRVNVHGLLNTPTLTHVHTHMDVGKGHSTYTLFLHHLSLSAVLAGSLCSERSLVLLSPQLFFFPYSSLSYCFYFTWTGFLLSKRINKYTFSQIIFCQYSIIPVQKTFNEVFKQSILKEKHSPLAFATLLPTPLLVLLL